jgi:hypothetical protein
LPNRCGLTAAGRQTYTRTGIAGAALKSRGRHRRAGRDGKNGLAVTLAEKMACVPARREACSIYSAWLRFSAADGDAYLRH